MTKKNTKKVDPEYARKRAIKDHRILAENAILEEQFLRKPLPKKVNLKDVRNLWRVMATLIAHHGWTKVIEALEIIATTIGDGADQLYDDKVTSHDKPSEFTEDDNLYLDAMDSLGVHMRTLFENLNLDYLLNSWRSERDVELMS